MMLCYRRLIDDDQAAQLRISVSRLCVIPSGGCRSRGINAERFSYPRAKPYSVIRGYDSRAGTGAVSIAYRRDRTPACRHAGTFRCAGRLSNRPAPLPAPHGGRAGPPCGAGIQTVSTAGGRVAATPSIARYLRSSSVSISTCGRPSSRSLIRVPISFMWSVLRWLSNDAWS